MISFLGDQRHHCSTRNSTVQSDTTVTKYLLVATRVKNKISGQILLITVASNFLKVNPPRKRGFADTILSAAEKGKL